MKSRMDEVSLAAKHSLAFQYKRMKKYSSAYDYWKQVSEKGPGQLKAEAWIELAKLAEHQFKQFEQAMMFSEKAYEEMDNRATRNERALLELSKRLERLERKLAK